MAEATGAVLCLTIAPGVFVTKAPAPWRWQPRCAADAYPGIHDHGNPWMPFGGHTAHQFDIGLSPLLARSPSPVCAIMLHATAAPVTTRKQGALIGDKWLDRLISCRLICWLLHRTRKSSPMFLKVGDNKLSISRSCSFTASWKRNQSLASQCSASRQKYSS